MKSYTYKDSGVDTAAGAQAVDAYKPLAAATERPGVMGGIGAFAGLFDPRAAGFRDPVLVAATDGVGTKLMLAIEAGQHESVGIDLVAMCVNDLIVAGAEPLFFLDYFATAQLDPAQASEIVGGIAQGCREAGCALIGGETAEMPGLYREGDYDLAGFAVGAMERERAGFGQDVGAGDVLIGLASSGLHSNGFSLVRQLLADQEADLAAPAPFAPGISLGEALLTPTRIYVASVLAAIEVGLLRGLSHITGGGFAENVPRMLGNGLAARIDGTAWHPPPVFSWLTEAGAITTDEMVRTFNCGIGMIAAVRAAEADSAIEFLTARGEQAHRIGEIVAAEAGTPTVVVEGLAFA